MLFSTKFIAHRSVSSRGLVKATFLIHCSVTARRFCDSTSPSCRLPRVVVISGPTSIGKSATAAQLAAEINGELISADGIKIYKGLNVGSNKQSTIQLAHENNVPLHLVDIVEPNFSFSMAAFARKSRSLAQDIIQRGKVAVVFGGTGFYINGFLLGPSTAPKRDVTVAEKISSLVKEDGDWEKSFARLAKIDPEAASNITKNNYFRLCRALEINMTTGKTLSSFKMDNLLPYDIRAFCLTSSPRSDMYRNIDLRCEKMILMGLLEEASQIMSTYGPPVVLPHPSTFTPDTPTPTPSHLSFTVSNAIGYRHAFHFLLQKNLDSPSFHNFLERFQVESRNFARKQLSWFQHQFPVPCVYIDMSKTTDVVKWMHHLMEVDREVFDEQVKVSMEVLCEKSESELKQLKEYQTVFNCFDGKSEVGKKNTTRILNNLTGMSER